MVGTHLQALLGTQEVTSVKALSLGAGHVELESWASMCNQLEKHSDHLQSGVALLPVPWSRLPGCGVDLPTLFN